MKAYAATGLCPHCGRKVLDSPLPGTVIDALRYDQFLPDSLAPYGAPVSLSRFRARMTCQICGEHWPVRQPFLGNGMARRRRERRTGSVDVSGSRILGIEESGELEEQVIEIERHPFTNSSRTAPATRQLEISNSIERTAQIDSSSVSRHGGGATLSVLGLGSVMGQLQQEISQRYALTSRSSLTVRESVSVEVAPRTAVELVVEWKTVCARGDIRLGTGRRGQDALVPYRVPVRLTFVAEVRDLPYRET
ncbi:hypothetical protein JK361_27725 [Streptomyces sp. 5-8]|uniref:Nmd3 N-terminal domain-containing protein n=1 Tax=Streptomyces musisoli TaxID=2802280 RepID=A0ABS1P7K1_9ACTN|nr:hypothetical protein [Streptomyces musisoli]MBL1108334.1 hypothetical protein [Streptomyces musisoli]